MEANIIGRNEVQVGDVIRFNPGAYDVTVEVVVVTPVADRVGVTGRVVGESVLHGWTLPERVERVG